MARIQAAQLTGQLKVRQMFAWAFGGTIGAAWITMTGIWISQAGSIGAISGLVFGGLVILLVVLCYVEMASIYPVAGAELVFAYETFGPKIAFATGWMALLLLSTVLAFLAVSASWIFSALLSGVQSPVIYHAFGAGITLIDLLVAVGSVLAFSLLNIRGGGTAARFQDWSTMALILSALVVIVTGLISGSVENLTPAFVDQNDRGFIHGILVIFATSPLWYGGFNVLSQAMGECAENVDVRKAALAMLLSTAAAMLFYVLLILATAMTMPREQLLQLNLPVAGALEYTTGSVLAGKAVLTVGLIGIVTSINGLLFAASRVIFSLGRSRLFPPVFSAIHPRFGSPYVAIATIGLMSAFISLLGLGAISRLVNVGGMCFALLFLAVTASVLRLRYMKPEINRQFRIYKGKFVSGLATMAVFSLLAWSIWDARPRGGGYIPVEWGLFFGWAVVGLIAWLLTRTSRNSVTESERQRLILGQNTD